MAYTIGNKYAKNLCITDSSTSTYHRKCGHMFFWNTVYNLVSRRGRLDRQRPSGNALNSVVILNGAA